LAKYFAAVGGKEAAAKLKTTVMKGTLEFDRDPKERNGQIEVTLKEPDKYLLIRTTPQGTSTVAVNGEAAWVKSSNGLRKLSAREMELSKRSAAAYYSTIKVVDQPAQMKVLGTEKIGDRETYELALVIDPDTTTKFFFDTQNRTTPAAVDDNTNDAGATA
jgi:outer membrane lipoprotein-sorting protein